jgi:predicted Zn-dependent protease
VVAHEIAHILQKHQARMMHGQRGAQFTSLAALALAHPRLAQRQQPGGQVTEAAIASAGALSIQSQIDYTREHEREADRVGLTLLERAGLDPRGMATFFERLLRANRLNEFKGAPSYLRTHPLTRSASRTSRTACCSATRSSSPIRSSTASPAPSCARAPARHRSCRLFRTMLADKTVVRPRRTSTASRSRSAARANSTPR